MPPGCCQTNVVPASTQVTGVIGEGESVCKNASQTIIVAGGGTTFEVQNGGSVTMIAGQNIRFLDDTRVFAGGYLHAYITTNGEYCCASTQSMATNPPDVPEVIPEADALAFIKIFPNPTDDKVYIELDPTLRNTKTVVRITGMLGNLIRKEEVTGNDRYEFSLIGQTPGVYLIRVMAGNRLETKKIVRK